MIPMPMSAWPVAWPPLARPCQAAPPIRSRRRFPSATTETCPARRPLSLDSQQPLLATSHPLQRAAPATRRAAQHSAARTLLVSDSAASRAYPLPLHYPRALLCHQPGDTPRLQYRRDARRSATARDTSPLASAATPLDPIHSRGFSVVQRCPLLHQRRLARRPVAAPWTAHPASPAEHHGRCPPRAL